MDRPVTETILFCRALRERGLTVTPAEVIDAVTALDLIDLDDRRETHLSLRTILASRVEDFPIFEELFEAFWNRLGHGPRRRVEPEVDPQPVRRSSRGPGEKGLAYFLEHWGAPESRTAEPIQVPAAGSAESRSEKDFGSFETDELDEISRVVRRIVRRLARHPSRRWRPVKRGPRVDLRRTLRLCLKTGGEVVELSRKRRRPKKTRLVVICDVSGSMDLYSRILLQFVYGLQNSFARVETFVFSTSLERITGHLKDWTYQQALKRLAAGVRSWSGGTLIGPSLAAFNSGWPGLVDSRTIVMILSDGWDTGEPQELAAALTEIRRRAGKLIWLNPLLGSPTYQPLARGMQAALPHIEVFAPLHNLASLRALERHLLL
ncbi:MAG TPA: VWA domain-containing protein [Blastocatellia bacterium]|nr:VWA domain-containing protein [Blastocatellia bacterium]